MGGRVWSWLLAFAPVQHAVRREVAVAVDRVMDDTEQAQARQRERHRIALGRAERQLGDLRELVDELTQAKAELLVANASLHAHAAELEQAAEREAAGREEFAQRLVREQEAALAQQWHDATSDVFCCQSCWAFWFLTTAQDRLSCTVHGPVGRHDTGCTVCAEPLVALPAAKSVVFRKQAEGRVSRPAPAEEGADAGSPGAAQLTAIADGLARLPKVTSRTIAWVAADLTGSAELPAKVLGEIATRTTMAVPLDGMVAGIRAFVEVRSQRV
jgi:hypothetical protein